MNNTIAISIILILFSVLCFFIAIYLFFFSNILKGRTLGVMFFSSSVATFAYMMELPHSPLGCNYQWVIIRYISLLTFALTIALFVFDYSGIPISFISWRFLGLAFTPGMALFLLIINPNSPKVYSQDGISVANVLLTDKTIGPTYIILQSYVTGLLVVLIYILLKDFGQQTKLDRINSIFIASGLFLYVSTHIMHLAGVKLMGTYSLNIFTYFPSSVLALWGVRRYRLADIRPIAYNSIFYQIQDGILVIDRRGHLVDFNPAAEAYLAISKHFSPGDFFDPKELQLKDFLDIEDFGKEKIFQSNMNGIQLQFITTGLFDQSGNLYGYLVSVRDISSQIEAERLKKAEIIREGACEERMRLARALHDSALQNVGSLIMLAGSIKQFLGEKQSEDIKHSIEHLATGARLAYEDLRSFIDELQIEDNVDLTFNLRDALIAKIEYLNQQNNTDVHLKISGRLNFNAGQQRELFYIILEATNNAMKHAGAESVDIHIEVSPETVSAEIVDDGCGFNIRGVDDKRMGLKNLHSRASLLNGQLMISSVPNEGTMVRIEFPRTNEDQKRKKQEQTHAQS